MEGGGKKKIIKKCLHVFSEMVCIIQERGKAGMRATLDNVEACGSGRVVKMVL